MINLYFKNLWRVIKYMLTIIISLIAFIGVVLIGVIFLSWISVWFVVLPLTVLGSAGLLTWLELKGAL